MTEHLSLDQAAQLQRKGKLNLGFCQLLEAVSFKGWTKHFSGIERAIVLSYDVCAYVDIDKISILS